MGQKINPKILRLNNRNNWNYKYIEKKIDEQKLYIQTFLEQLKYTNLLNAQCVMCVFVKTIINEPL